MKSEETKREKGELFQKFKKAAKHNELALDDVLVRQREQKRRNLIARVKYELMGKGRMEETVEKTVRDSSCAVKTLEILEIIRQ